MASFQSTGTVTSQTPIFNSGYLTINGKQTVDVLDISITKSYDVKTYYALNSIKARDIRRSHFSASVKCTIKGMPTELYSIFFSSSSAIAGGDQWNVLDGQQLTSTVYLTAYVNVDGDVTKEIQYQLVNPVIRSFDPSLKAEDWNEVAVEVDVTDLILLTKTGAES